LELVDVLTGNQIWGEQYNRKLTDLTHLQSEIARDVSNKLQQSYRVRMKNEPQKLHGKHGSLSALLKRSLSLE
jgi:hypothetical protein